MIANGDDQKDESKSHFVVKLIFGQIPTQRNASTPELE